MTNTRDKEPSLLLNALYLLLIVLLLGWIPFALLGRRTFGTLYDVYPALYVCLFSMLALALGLLNANAHYRRKSYPRSGLCVYLAISAVALNYICTALSFQGYPGLRDVLRASPLSNFSLTLSTVVIAWLLIGSILVLLERRIVKRENLTLIAGFYFVAFLYLNFLRERPLYGDVAVYIEAAYDLVTGQPVGTRYLYPPFFATCLRPLLYQGDAYVEAFLTVLNYFSLLLLYMLLYATLIRYGFSRNLAALLVFVSLAVNVPVLRNFGYVQVNTHIANLILLSLLLSGKNVFLSALALSLAFHMKTSPLVLVLAFIVAKQWKWLIWFILISSAITGLTILLNGAECYQYYFTNIGSILNTEGATFRDNSIDSFVRATSGVLGVKLPAMRVVIMAVKAGVTLVTVWLMVRVVSRRVFYEGGQGNASILNSFVVLLFLMVLLSPLIWAHHLVLVIFPFLVLLGSLSRPLEWILYFAAYCMVFLIPTFDFYPFSYKILAAIIICYALFFLVLSHPNESSGWLRSVTERIDRIVDSGSGNLER